MTTDNFCFYLKNRLIQTSQTGDQWYSDTSPFSIPCIKIGVKIIARTIVNNGPVSTLQGGRGQHGRDGDLREGQGSSRGQPGPNVIELFPAVICECL